MSMHDKINGLHKFKDELQNTALKYPVTTVDGEHLVC